MENYLIFMRKSMKIKKISISSKTKKSFIFDATIVKIIQYLCEIDSKLRKINFLKNL